METLKHITILILSGCPASGKSSFAREFIKKNSNRWVIVNRDAIREMLGLYWVPSREDLVSDIEKQMISSAIDNGYNIIVDATNLNNKIRKYCESLIKIQSQFVENDISITIEYKEFILPLWRLYLNDFKRKLFGGRSVGFKVIKTFYDKYYNDK
jgi:tRNA uridine 5-carbamoylmethylation protein Kti12